MLRLSSACFAAAILAAGSEGCSTIVAGRLATTDGSVIGAHSNDGDGDTPGNINKVVAKDWPKGSVRPPGVPQVPHTFGYYGAGYATMNEYQVGMSESTCGAVYVSRSKGGGGKALLNIVDLGQIGLERGTTARDTITIMGTLGARYGFYGSDSEGGSGESLFVTDKTEAYIFHILPDSSLSGAIWAAQRVPADHIAVVANCFTIRDVNLTDSANFLVSANMKDEAAKRGWDPRSGPLDFAGLFSPGEYGAHKYVDGRRMWGLYHLLAPEHKLSPFYDDIIKSKPYPATLKPAKKVSLTQLMAAMRFQYEGTEFDLTKGPAAGPWSTPMRWAGGGADIVDGWWERPVGYYRTIIGTIVQSRASLPDAVGGVMWVAPHAAPTSCYVPFAAGMQELGPQYTTNGGTLDRSKAWWVHRILLNVASLKYNYTIVPINAQQQESEDAARALVAANDAAYLKHGTMAPITASYNAHAAKVTETFAALGDTLLQHYADGFCNGCGLGHHVLPYPDWWLREVGFDKHPSPPAAAEADDAVQRAKRCIAACPEESPARFQACVTRCVV